MRLRPTCSLLLAALLLPAPAAALSLGPIAFGEVKAREFAEANKLSVLLVASLSGIGGEYDTVKTGPDGDSSEERVWRWASVTKQIVAVLVLQEVERGRIDLDAPAQRYLPGVALPGGDAVTVRHLLQHRSGLFDPEDGPKASDGTPIAYTRSAPVPAAGIDPQCLQPTGRVPGSQFRYNNCDYVIAGALLEAVTGRSFADLIATRIARNIWNADGFRVLHPGDRDDITGRDANGATDAGVDIGRYGAAANLAGRPSALASFDLMLISGQFLKPESLATLWQGDPRLGFAALGAWSYTVPLKGCAKPVAIVERRGQVGFVQVRNILIPARQIAIVAFADKPVRDFGEPWQGKGLTYDMLSTILCPEEGS